MRLTDAIQQPSRPGKPCSVQVALDRLAIADPELFDDLSAWFRGERMADVTDGQVHEALQGLGYRVGVQTVGRHRRATQGRAGGCGCAA